MGYMIRIYARWNKMSMKLWRIKQLLKKIANYETQLRKFKYYVTSCKAWIKEDTKQLEKLMKDVSDDEYNKIILEM